MDAVNVPPSRRGSTAESQPFDAMAIFEDISRDDVHQAIDRLVEGLLDEAGLTAPPVDAVALARSHLRLPPPSAKRYARRRQKDESDPTPQQQQWEAARQIGAHLQAALLRRLGADPEQRRGAGGTSLPSLVATHLLAPAGWFNQDARRLGHDLLQLQELYSTAGIESVAWRLLDVGEPCIITVVEDDRVVRRRSNAWPVRRQLLGPERACQRHVHRTGRQHVLRAEGWTVQGWPIHGPERKREILRSVGEEG
jgi:hypothetical protein